MRMFRGLYLTFLVLICLSTIIYAQTPTFNDTVISTITEEADVSLEYGDIDNDGDQDLLIARNFIASCEVGVFWHENLGDGTFSSGIQIRLATLDTDLCSDGGGITAARFIDADNDGNLDVIIGEYSGTLASSENMILYYGDGHGNFPTSILLDVFPFSPSLLKVFDFDGDGLDDIFMAEPSDGFSAVKLYWYKNTNGSTFNFDPATFLVFINLADDVEFVDVDNDLNADIVFRVIYGDPFDPSIRIDWFKGDGNGGTVGGLQTLVDNIPVSAITDFKVLDLNNDGNLDIGYIGDNSFGWFSGDSTQNFTLEQEINGISTGTVFLRGLSSGDINQNGYTDLVFCLGGSFDRIHLLTNNSGSSFSLSTINSIDDFFVFSVVVDIDNDGDLDPISAGGFNRIWHETSLGTTGGPEIYFSEYVEGSGTNKALEIANYTGSSVNLSDYTIRIAFNGNPFGSDIDFPSDAAVSDGDVYVIANSGLATECVDELDLVNNSMTSFNGNDAIGLFKSGVLVDIIGIEGNSSNFAQNITLIRKPSISEPTTVFDINQWDSYSQDDCSNLGSHSQTLSVNHVKAVDYKIYPNPTTNYLSIESRNNIREAHIYSILGKKMLSFVNQNHLDIRHIPNGIYFMKIIDEEKQFSTLKFIKN